MIGLAVVVALALAAVFGAMSLTNPAFAAVGAPADAELAERTFSPQDVLLKWHEGDTEWTIDPTGSPKFVGLRRLTYVRVSEFVERSSTTVLTLKLRPAVSVTMTPFRRRHLGVNVEGDGSEGTGHVSRHNN